MRSSLTIILVLFLVGCYPKPSPGPDKQGGSMWTGAALGAGTGAIAGFHLTSLSGPGALVGAGFGAVAGGIHGFVHDLQDEALLVVSRDLAKQKEIAKAHEILAEHFRRRVELHPTRDIFPADLFFDSDQVSIKKDARVLVEELAWLNKTRYPWSRLVIASYVKSRDAKSDYASFLARRRARELGNYLVRAGIEARRITTRSIIVPDVVLLDPADRADRYAQAIELIPIDR